MGTVFLAEQEEPVQRLVALKTIRPGAFSEQAAARFELECQALASMDHPGIAKIFDGGLTESGLPYFVMEYAPGLPLTDYCDRYRLALEERCELLAKVTDAVQHAHEKGVVHRDLKPGNVLVEAREGVALPKVVDFGIARALAGPLGRGQVAPALAERLGTPAFMSPERLSGVGVGVDTRDDVYSLGVVLYELLCGRLPYEAAGRVELARALERDPPAPSRRLHALAPEDARQVAELRATTARALERSLTGELDAIALRALALDPRRRYGTAHALSEDLRRLRADQPVSALPSTTLYRARKFARRHRLGLAATAVALVSLGAGLVVALRGLQLARRAEDAAERRARSERGEREEADLLVRAFKEALLHAEASEVAAEELRVGELLRVLAGDIEALARGRPEAEAALRASLGRCLLVIGQNEAARQQFLRAYAVGGRVLDDDPLDRFDVLEGLIEATRRTGDRAGARAYVAQALEVARVIFAGHDARFLEALEALMQLAAGHPLEGPRALAALETVLAAHPDVLVRGDESGVTARIVVEAAAQLMREGVPEAPAFCEALDARARGLLPADDLRLVQVEWTLARVFLQPEAKGSPEAERAARRLVAGAEQRLFPGHWMRGDARCLLARALELRGAFDEAEENLLLALDEERRGRALGGSAPSTAAEGFDALSAGVAALAPTELAAFLDRSWERRLAAGPALELWWPVARPGLSPALAGAAVTLLSARTEDAAARRELGPALIRAGRDEEGLSALASDAGPAELGLRVIALARLGRRTEARAALGTLEARGTAAATPDPLALQLLDEARAVFGR